MHEAAEFLTSLARALSSMALYKDGHPARERALDRAYHLLQELQAEEETPRFTFLDGKVMYGEWPIPRLRSWDWSERLAAAGIQRLEFSSAVDRVAFAAFLDDILLRLNVWQEDSGAGERGPSRDMGILYGVLGVRGKHGDRDRSTAAIDLSLSHEAGTVHWLHADVARGHRIPVAEAAAVVAALAVAMRSGQHMMLPRLDLSRHDDYATTHALNVAVLSMGLAEWMGLDSAAVRELGLAGLLHDIGMVRVPPPILSKDGKLTEAERAVVQRHTLDGARIIVEAGIRLDMAAVVAYEHHIGVDGAGYPGLHYPRSRHPASGLVQICDVYDALRTDRPYRDAWSEEQALGHLEGGAGTEFDADAAQAFAAMMGEWEPRTVAWEPAGES